jgi:hypothetical protein
MTDFTAKPTNGQDSFVSDGDAVDVTLNRATLKGKPGYFQGFHGMTQGAGSSGDLVALEISNREHELVVGSGVSAAKGAILYIHFDGTVDATASNGVPFLKVTVAKDANNVVWGVILPQNTTVLTS